MNKIIFGLFLILALFAEYALAQTLEVSVGEEALKAGAPLTAVATISNTTDNAVEWVFESHLYSTTPTAPVPRKFSKEVRLGPGESTTIELSFDTQWLVYSGEYHLISEVFSRPIASVAKSKQTVSLVGGLEHLDVQLLLCEDKNCRKPSKLFEQGATVYIAYQSNTGELDVSATVNLPDESTVELELPAELIAQQIGDYVVNSLARKEGHVTDRDTVVFAAIPSTQDVHETLLKRQE